MQKLELMKIHQMHFNTIKITSLSEKIETMNIPEKQIILIISVIIIIGTVGLLIRK